MQSEVKYNENGFDVNTKDTCGKAINKFLETSDIKDRMDRVIDSMINSVDPPIPQKNA